MTGGHYSTRSLALAVGRSLKRNAPAYLTVGLLVGVVLYCVVQHDRRTLHSFRVSGTGSLVLTSLKNGSGWQYDTASMKEGDSCLVEGIEDALVRLDSGRAVVYSALRPAPVSLDLPSTLRLTGVYNINIHMVRGRLDIAVGGRTNSIRYGDQSMGSKASLRKYGSELVPSILEEQRNASLFIAGAIFAVLQLPHLVREILRR